MARAITTVRQAASWVASVDSSFTRKDVVTLHRQTGIENGHDFNSLISCLVACFYTIPAFMDNYR